MNIIQMTIKLEIVFYILYSYFLVTNMLLYTITIVTVWKAYIIGIIANVHVFRVIQRLVPLHSNVVEDNTCQSDKHCPLWWHA